MNIETHSPDIGLNEVERAKTATLGRRPLEREDLYCILQVHPNDSLTAMELARQLSGSGQLEEAVRVLSAVVKIDYRFETLLALGRAEYEAQNDEMALEHLHQASVVAPEYVPELFELYKLMGNVFVRLGSYDLAQDSYNRAYRLNPNSDLLQVNLGALAIQRKDWEGAHQHFRQAVELNKLSDKGWVGLAIVHRMKGDLELSWGNIMTAIELNPLNEAAMNLIVDWGLAQSQDALVYKLLRAYLGEGGWSENLSMVFAALCLLRGDRAMAKLEVERVLAVNPAHEKALKMSLELRGRGVA